MSKRYYDPPQIRYLRARLSVFQKPWLRRSAILMLIISIIGWQYTSNPNFFAQFKDGNRKTTESANKPELNITTEEQSIAADIDNIPTLLDDFQKSAITNVGILPSEDFNPGNKKNFSRSKSAENVNSHNKETNAEVKDENIFNNSHNILNNAKSDNQFINAADNLLRFSSQNNKTAFLGINYLNNSSQSHQQLGKSTAIPDDHRDTLYQVNQLYQTPLATLTTTNYSTVQFVNQTSNYNGNNSVYMNTMNQSNNHGSHTINNLPNQTFSNNNKVGNVDTAIPIQPTINSPNSSPTNIYPYSSTIINHKFNNHTSLPTNYTTPNNTIIPTSNIPGTTSNDSGASYVNTPLNTSNSINMNNP